MSIKAKLVIVRDKERATCIGNLMQSYGIL